MQETSLDESTGPRRGSVRSTGTKPAAIRAHGLGRRFNGVMAVDDLDLEIASGEIYGFLGPNGAGKSDLGLTDAGSEQLASAQSACLETVTFSLCRRAGSVTRN
jgi:ABC-type polysaccharide/polyol phosphate transport system ATPase subunit